MFGGSDRFSVYLPRKLFHDPDTSSTSPVKNNPVRNNDTIRNMNPGLKTAKKTTIILVRHPVPNS